MRITMLLRVLLVAGGLGLLAAACGDDGGTTTPAGDDGTTDPADDDGSSSTGDGTSDGSTDDGAADGTSTGDGGSTAGPDDRSSELTGSWTITAFQLPGATGLATPVGAPSIVFDGAGTVLYDTGCNTGEGPYEARGVYFVPDDENGPPEGQPIEFGALSQTEIACGDDYADQDLAIGGAIRAANRFVLTDDTLTLWRDGNVMIEATRP